jgi:hypothetical protein
LYKSKSRRHPAITITDADYADDIAVFSDYLHDATTLLHKIEKTASEIGLYINTKKLNTSATIKIT